MVTPSSYFQPFLPSLLKMRIADSKALTDGARSCYLPAMDTLTTRREAAIESILSSLTLEEKVSQLLHGAPAIPHAGLPAYNWWSEALHGVGRNGKATVFPQTMNLGATFDPELAKAEGETIAREARAKFNIAASHPGDQYCGLTFWSPNVNIFRDPRWGRGQETYGEDPFLSATLGAAFVHGMQGPDPEHHMTVAACAKHFAVHSGPERLRHEFDARPTPKDLRETYLPAFQALVEAGVEAVMGAYNRVNGEPCCGSKLLLVDILRGEWGFQGHVVSDCWAVRDFWKSHKVCDTPAEAAALAIKRGCDLNCGETYTHALAAVRAGLLDEADIDRALRRLLRTRAKLGLFDPPEENPWRDLGHADIDTPAARALALRTARESVVLLKNDAGLLPLDPAKLRRLHVVGPHAASLQALVGNYHGLSGRLVSILEGIAEKTGTATSATLSFAPGGPVAHESLTTNIGEYWGSDAIVACFGLDGTLEGEEGDAIDADDTGDRLRIELPMNQLRMLRRIRDTGRPVILLLFGGSPIAVPPDIADAILWVGYPGEEGGTAVADILFGDVAPSGHLPITWPRATADLPPFDDYAMAGRTYKFMEKEPLWPFGFGLSYTTFAFGEPRRADGSAVSGAVPADGKSLAFEVPVRNTGSRDGTCVAQVYVAKAERGPLDARCALKAFARVDVPAGGEALARFELPAKAFETVDESGASALRPGRYIVTVADCAPVVCAGAAARTLPVSFEVAL